MTALFRKRITIGKLSEVVGLNPRILGEIQNLKGKRLSRMYPVQYILESILDDRDIARCRSVIPLIEALNRSKKESS